MQHEEETQRLNQPTGEDEYKPLEGLETKLHANSRKNFVSKVYGILCAQLLLTCAFVTLGVVNDAVNMFLRTNVVLLVVSFVVSLITIYSLSCYKSLARSVPTNYILLFIFTAAETYMVAAIAARYSPKHVLLAAILTSVMVVALTAYSCVTEIDYTKLLPYMIIGCIILLAASICAMFIRVPILHTIISAVTVFFFSIYLIVDTQLVLGGKTYEISMDDYVLAAVNLYLDIIIIFIEILKLIGEKR